MSADPQEGYYVFTNPYTGKSYFKKRPDQQPVMQNSATMPHPEVMDNTENFDFNQLFDTGASKNRCNVKRRPTVTSSVTGRSGKVQKTGRGSIPQNIHLQQQNSNDTEKPDDDDISGGSGDFFEEKVKNIIDDKIGGDLQAYTRNKFVKSIRDPITKAQKEGLERFRTDVLPKLNVVNSHAQDAVSKTVQFRMEYDNNRTQDRRFQQFVVEKLGQMNGTIEALGRYILTKLGSNDGLDDSSLNAILNFDGYAVNGE
ncbi:hypothetical protein SEMRO_75_G041110.1 [Seminavis robusta]|uniref:Uncharacterized protein n=1 Tax=Seminavis robusta TaxID=568900 RepID=A0A9N8DG15_9STRA|nr:hypothetical protein SEMRO_75_G041110.1 [Seminavis robusta]|eukprot:Sro75_g041110.1 n/a (256) ;mRNA; r:42474-43241